MKHKHEHDYNDNNKVINQIAYKLLGFKVEHSNEHNITVNINIELTI